MDDDNEGNNLERNGQLEEDGAIRRNQVLIFGVILLGILAICLAVSMPSELEFHEAELPSSAVPINSEVTDRSAIPSSVDPSSGKRNQTNSTIRKKTLQNPEVSVEVKLLRDMAIQKKIQEYYGSSNIDSENSENERLFNNDENERTDSQFKPPLPTKEELEAKKVNSIVETFISSDDFEDFLIDMEINDAVKRLKQEKGYKSRPTTIFDELFKRAEKEFIGEDEEELRLIKRVGEELEKRARDIIIKRKAGRGEELTEPEELLASELLKIEFSGSGGDSAEDYQSTEQEGGEEESILQTHRTEL